MGTKAGNLAEGERLLLFTDGIPEILMPNGREIGIMRFVQMFAANKQIPIEQALFGMVSAADQIRGARAQDDDWTLVAVERQTQNAAVVGM